MCRKGARFSPASRLTTICAWGAPIRAAPSRIPSLACSRSFPASSRFSTAAAARQQRTYHDPCRAEPRLHRCTFKADSHHSEGNDHPGSAARRSRRCKPCRRIYRNHHLSSIQRAAITGRQTMAVRRTTLDQLRSVAEDLGMHMGEEELKSYDTLMQGNYAAYDLVDAMPDYVPAGTCPRTPGYSTEGEENKHNAWYVKTTIKGEPGGKLAGKTIA